MASSDVPLAMISADSHVIEPVEIWTDIIPPSFWPDNGKGFRAKPGALDPEERRESMAADGVAGEVLYPSLGLKVFGHPDAEVHTPACVAYNTWLTDYCAGAPDRLFAIAMIPAFDAEAAIAEMRRCKARGFVGFMLWQSPHPDLPFSSSHYEPIWEIAEELQLPLSLHILTGFDYSRDFLEGGPLPAPLPTIRAAVNQKLLAVMDATLEIVVSGVLHRHPGLRLVLVENETTWLPFAIQQWDYYASRFLSQMEIDELPSTYCARQLYATFFADRLVENVLPWWGSRNCMWSNDYPHVNSTWPNSRAFVSSHLGDLTDDALERVLRTNVQDLYALESNELL